MGSRYRVHHPVRAHFVTRTIVEWLPSSRRLRVATVSQAPDAQIVVLTTYAGDDRIHRALEAGASAYLLKDAVTNVLLEAIRKVHGGGSFVDSAVATKLAQRSMSGPPLSDREIEVLKMISGGKSNKEIAAALFVAESTVKTHVATIYEKLRVTDRT